ncbi:MAG: PAS domain-containing sensor histidine kinase [Alphaproteobacteria bacterium]
MTKTAKTRKTRPRVAIQKPPRITVASGFAEFAFIVTGIVLTMAVFLTVNFFVKRAIYAEYESMSDTSAQAMAENFAEFETTINVLGTVFGLSPQTEKEVVAQKVRETKIPMERFDQVFLAYKKVNGAWSFKTLYKTDDSDGRRVYSLNADKLMLSRIVQPANFETLEPQVLSDPELFSPVPQETDGSRPFLLMRAIRQYDQTAGLLVGVAQAGSVLKDKWQQNEAMARVGLRDPAKNRDVFFLSRYSENDKPWTYDRVYEFAFGGSVWELRTEYSKKDNVAFLESVPGMMVVFGFVLTLVGIVYLRNHKVQHRRMMSLNRVLEDKNLELRDEMIKRENLTSTLIRSESENRAVIDSVSDVIFEADISGKILFLNKTWQKITGFETEQSTGQELFRMLHPQDQEKQAKDFQMLVRGQKQPYRTFTRLRTVDGTFRAVELAISVMRQDETRTQRVVGTFTDVEERRRAERALGEAEKKFRAIVENAAGGIFQITPEGMYLSANPALARILDYDGPEQLLRQVKNANDVIYGSIRERQAFLKELEARGAIYNHETQVVTLKGQKIWVNENVRVVRDESNNTLYYEGSMEDITQRKQAEIALREAKIRSDLANRAKSEFLANMSHELRTPLNSIIGFAEIIHKETFGPIGQDPYKEYSREIHDSGRKLLKVINEILDISRIEANERRLNESIVSVPGVIKACLKLLENKSEASKLTITNMLGDLPDVIGEELAIKQIGLNLLSNAIKFTPPGGRVTISGEVDRQGLLRISFTDTGVGLDEHEIEKALSPFGQVDNALNRNNAGTGLGLTLVDALIKLHDGKLELFSKKGIGTTATIIFPSDRVAQKKPAAPAAQPNASTPDSNPVRPGEKVV